MKLISEDTNDFEAPILGGILELGIPDEKLLAGFSGAYGQPCFKLRSNAKEGGIIQ